MTTENVRFVTEKALAALKFTDPYTQDFYYLQKGLRTNAALRERAIKEQTAMPQMIMVPQPLWRDFKERIQLTLKTQQEKLLGRMAKWEDDNQVLGHVVRSNAATPKVLMSVPSLSTVRAADNASEETSDHTTSTSDGGLPFTSKLWTMRLQVQRGYEALSTVQELNHLLRSSNISSDPLARNEILYEVEKAVANLAASVGVCAPDPGAGTTGSDSSGSGSGSTGTGPPASGPPPVAGMSGAPKADSTGSGNTSGSGIGEVKLEPTQVAVILQSAKGKKLMSRAFGLLEPDYRWALLPAILARLLLTEPKEQSDEEKEVEAKLLKTLLQFIQHSHQYQLDQQEQLNSFQPGVVAPFSVAVLTHIRKCIAGVMVAHDRKEALRSSLLSSRPRATLLHQIVTVGDKVRENMLERISSEAGQFVMNPQDKQSIAYCMDEWVQSREGFMKMLDASE